MMELKMTSNLNEISAKINQLVSKTSGIAMRQMMYSALELIGFRAVSEYMIQTTLEGAVYLQSDPYRLTIRTGRLAGSIVAAPRFSKSELPTEIESLIGQKPRTVVRLPGVGEAINEVEIRGAIVEAWKGSKVEYAARHELGGGIKARPFLRPALRDSEPLIVKMIETMVNYQIKKQGL